MVAAGGRAVDQLGLEEGLLGLLGVLVVALRHGVAHDHDLARDTRRTGPARVGVYDAKLRTLARTADGKRPLTTGQLLIGKLDVGNGHR